MALDVKTLALASLVVQVLLMRSAFVLWILAFFIGLYMYLQIWI